MPTYSYQCKVCDHLFDVFHPMSAKRRIKCEVCGSRCRRLIGTGAGIIFKGSGFYETDYKRSKESGDKSEASKKTETAETSDSPAKVGSSEKGESKTPAASTSATSNSSSSSSD